MKNSHLLRKGRFSQPLHYYVVTLVTYNRSCLFETLPNAQVVIKTMIDLEQEGFVKAICFTLMPDHLHWQFQLLSRCSLSDVIKRLKGRTTQQIKKGQILEKVWQADFYDHQIRNDEDLIKQARYIVANPLRAGLVNKVGDYPYWNCIYL